MKSMHFLAIFIFLATLTQYTLSIDLPPFPSVGDLPYQAHSFNDVKYIRQLLRRGVKYFKIDVSLANKESCIRRSDWNQTSKCYQTDQYAEEYCCLGMRGDTSGRNNFDYPFNTLDNFIDMVEQYISEHSISRILFFAINFQFDFQFSNQLVQSALYRLAKLMEKYPKLYFGSGSDNFIFEYDRICRNRVLLSYQEDQNFNQFTQPLQNLNEESCTEKRKFISLARFFLQSGSNDPSDPRDYYGRFRNFNSFYKDVVDRCNNGFPSWVKKHPEFPLVFWQPSDENQIQLVIQTFLSEKCKRHHGRDINGLAITSNIDPQVFEFYLKRINQSSLNPMVFYPNNQKLALQYANNFLSKIVMNNSDFLIFGQQDDATIDKKNGVNLELLVLSQQSKIQRVYQVNKKQLPATNGTIKIVAAKDNLIVVQNPLQKVEQKTVLITLLNGNLQKITDIEIDRYVDISSFDGQYYMLRQTVNPTIFNVIKTADFSKTSIILSFSLVLQKAKSIESFLALQDSEGKLRYFVSGSRNGTVWVGQVRNDNIYKSGIIGFGSNSKLTLKDDGLLAITMQNGQCNSGVQINNGDSPLCALYKFPQLKSLTSTKSTITLIQVTLTNLIQYLQKQTNQPVTPCTQKFIHSKVFNGQNINLVDIWSRLFFVSKYIRVSEQGMLNALFCAPSNFQKLSNNKKGLLGTIWSRGNMGVASQSKIELQNQDYSIVKK